MSDFELPITTALAAYVLHSGTQLAPDGVAVDDIDPWSEFAPDGELGGL